MKKKFSIADKREMLQQHEKGKPVIAFANEHKCDIRTIYNALDDAKRERDAALARSELMKEVLQNHQKRLEEEMKRIFTSLEVPAVEFAPLSWYEGDNSIFHKEVKESEKISTLGLAKKPGRPNSANITVTELLHQHLKYDPLWKLFLQNDKAHAEHISHRIAFQKRVVYFLETNTGYKVLQQSESNMPFLYSYTAGPAIYESCLRVMFKDQKKEEFVSGLSFDKMLGEVKYRNNILIRDRGNEEKDLKNILKAYNESLKSSLLVSIMESRQKLSECRAKVKPAFDEIVLLGYIPGSCSSCQKLGM